MPFLVLGLGSCSKSNTELPSDTDGKQQGTQEEVKRSLSKALSQMLSGFKASGSLDRDIHYLNLFYQSNDQVVTFDASYTFAEDGNGNNIDISGAASAQDVMDALEAKLPANLFLSQVSYFTSHVSPARIISRRVW